MGPGAMVGALFPGKPYHQVGEGPSPLPAEAKKSTLRKVTPVATPQALTGQGHHTSQRARARSPIFPIYVLLG